MNNRELITGFIGGFVVGGTLVWAYMYRVMKKVFDESTKTKSTCSSSVSPAVVPIEKNNTDPPKEKEEEDLKFIPFENAVASASGPTDIEPYVVTMEEADSEEVRQYEHVLLYYLVDDGVLVDQDNNEFTDIQKIGEENLELLGPDCEDVMIRNDEIKTIYEICAARGFLEFE